MKLQLIRIPMAEEVSPAEGTQIGHRDPISNSSSNKSEGLLKNASSHLSLQM